MRSLLLVTIFTISLSACMSTVSGVPFVDDPLHKIESTLDRAAYRVSDPLLKDGTFSFSTVNIDGNPHAPFTKKLEKIGNLLGSRKVPVIIYMHGCYGHGFWDEGGYEPLLRNSGLPFILIAPNSFGRLRPASCNGANNSTVFMERSNDYRIAELEFALEQIADLPWVEKIFLMGHSQGGGTVAEYRGEGPVAGRIIHAGACGSRGTWGMGYGIKPHEKIIVFHSNRDRWDWIARNSICPHLGHKNGGEVITTNMISHNLLPLPEFSEKLITWMRKYF